MENKEIYKEVRKELTEREKDSKELEELNNFLSEIDKPDLEATRIVQKAKIQIQKVDKALKKRGV